MGGDAEGKFLDMVTLDTKLSWGGGKTVAGSGRREGGRERQIEEGIILWVL